MSKSLRVTVRVPEKLEMDFMQRVISDGYGMKGKSRWVAESIKFFLNLPDFDEYVEYAEELESTGDNKLQSFYFKESLVHELQDSVINVRKKYPHLEGVRSLIIRASIIQRLFRVSEKYVGL